MTTDPDTRPRFAFGQVVMTRGLADWAGEEIARSAWLLDCLHRHGQCDWGEVCGEDWRLNDQALAEGTRLLSKYTHPETQTTIWIITEATREYTTALFPSEY